VLPEAVSATPLFGVLTLGDSEFLVMIDRVKTDDAFYCRIHLDRNRDRDLTNDHPLDGTAQRFAGRDYALVMIPGECELEYRLGDRTLPYRLEFSLRGQQLDEFDEAEIDPERLSRFVYITARAQSWYEGEIQLDGHRYRLALGDRNCNGLYSDTALVDENVMYVGRYPLYATGDWFYATEEDELTTKDALVLGDHLIIGERLFELEISAAERRLTLTPRTDGLLPLELDPAPERLLANTPGFERVVMMLNPGAEAELPPGSYRLLQYRLVREAEEGERWVLEAKGTKETAYVQLSGSAGSCMEFAEPFTSVAEVPERMLEWAEQNEGIEPRLYFNVEGRADELVSRLSRLSGTGGDIPMSTDKKDLPREPSYAIYTVSTNGGKLVKKNNFEYG